MVKSRSDGIFQNENVIKKEHSPGLAGAGHVEPRAQVPSDEFSRGRTVSGRSTTLDG